MGFFQTINFKRISGFDEHTDLLVVGFSATDYIGHQFGPDAEQTKDTYLKLDQTLADMLLFFDKQFGKKTIRSCLPLIMEPLLHLMY